MNPHREKESGKRSETTLPSLSHDAQMGSAGQGVGPELRAGL